MIPRNILADMSREGLKALEKDITSTRKSFVLPKPKPTKADVEQQKPSAITKVVEDEAASLSADSMDTGDVGESGLYSDYGPALFSHIGRILSY